MCYPSQIQHILQHEADPRGGLLLLDNLLHLVEVLVHARLNGDTIQLVGVKAALDLQSKLP